MRKLFTAAVFGLFAGLSSTYVSAENLDELLNQIEADISAQRLSSPANNNAADKIRRFRAEAPFDYRVLPYSYQIAEAYISFADKALASGKAQKAQNYLDKAWSTASLAEGLDEAQDKVNAAFNKSGKKPKQQVAKKKAVKKAEPKKVAKKKAVKKAEPKKVVKAKPAVKAATKVAAASTAASAGTAAVVAAATVSAADTAAKAAKAAAAKKKADAAKKEKARKLALAKKQKAADEAKRKAEAAKRLAAQQKAEEANRLLAAEKPAKQKAAQAAVGNPLDDAKETSEALASFGLDQDLIDNRSRKMKKELKPICQEIVDNNYSVVFHTKSVQDYRWLLLRMKLCMRKIDKSVRLRHSNMVDADNSPFVTLHPGRSSSLLRQKRG